jgi:two-component system chemotaxis response regulator CheB
VSQHASAGAKPRTVAGAAAVPAPPRPFTLRPLGPGLSAGIVAINLSTGGPAAVAEILAQLPSDFAAPLVMVPHMPQMFTRFFAERLNGQTPLKVVEATDGQVVEPGVVYVAPGDFHLTLQRRNGTVLTALDQQPPENSHRPAADVLFRSVAEAYGPRALALVLTGMGQDGLRGSEAITRAGGRVLVQDEATSVVWEMPGLVASAGLADAVLPLGELAGELRRRTT